MAESDEARQRELRERLVRLLGDFGAELQSEELRDKVRALIPAFRLLRRLGSSLIPKQEASAARDRILAYFRKYPLVVIDGDELMVVSGIQDWPRRIRELRRQFGWPIASGVTLQEMISEDETVHDVLGPVSLRPDQYILIENRQDREAALRWQIANDIRRRPLSVRNRLLLFLRENVGHPITGEELRYVANNSTEWARRVRELRTEYGWPIATRTTGRPDMPLGVYVLEQDRQSPPHERSIPDSVRRMVLRRDKYSCTSCGWSHKHWDPSDARHLELHHVVHHAEGGANDESNLITLCVLCHDEAHRE